MVSTTDQIEARFVNHALPSLSRYVEIECLSPAFDPDWERHGAIDAAIDHLAAWARTIRLVGAEVSVSRVEGATPALIVEVPAFGGGAGRTLLYGHLDKQPPLGNWSEGLDPYVPVRRDSLLYGRGTADDGYSLYASLLALESLQSAGIPHGSALVLIEASEESGSPDLGAHLGALESRLGEIDLVVCLDSGALDYERLWVTTSLRGNIVVTLSVSVLEHGMHSGEASGVVPSSFRILRQLLDRLEDPATGELRLSELHAKVPEHLLAAAASLSNELGDPLAHHFPTLPGLELMGRDGAERLINQSWAATLSVTGLAGAPAPEDAGNVLRASTTAKLSIRTPPSVDAASAQEAVMACLRAEPPSGATIEVTAEPSAQGWVAPKLAPWLAEALGAASLNAFGTSFGLLGEGGSIPFLADLTNRFPTAQFVVTGVLGPNSNAHGPDEALHLPTAVGVASCAAQSIAALSRYTVSSR